MWERPCRSLSGASVGKETDPAVTEAMQGYPDRAILNATEAQLKGAPDFHYAPSPVTQSETLPAGGGETKKTTP
jgi:hypothetical protein